MKKTGVFATKEEVKHLMELVHQPVMYLSGGVPLGLDPLKECHRIALAHGLPEINGYYGLDANGEFVTE